MTEPDVIEPRVDERPPGIAADHPPFRLRERRFVLLPDLRPPSLEELRWSARERRRRKGGHAPEQRRPIEHGQQEYREPADVPETMSVQTPPEEEQHTIVLPEAADVEASPFAAEPDIDHDLVDLTAGDVPEVPSPPVVLPTPDPQPDPAWLSDFLTATAPVEVSPVVEEPLAEPEPEAQAEAEAPPLVSQVLVVREPVSADAARIAVLDEVETDALVVTRLVPLPVEQVEPVETDLSAYEAEFLDEELEAEVDAEIDGRTAPLYWRLLRLRYTKPNGWLRALYFEGSVALGVVLVLAEAASVWTIVVLPLVVAIVVKANDVLAGNLRRTYRQPIRRSKT